ncbi:MAG: glycoside hydrolase family 127 protein [Planctomycetota bacterium]
MKSTEVPIAAIFSLCLSALCARADAVETNAQKDYPIQPVPFTDVRIEDEFWAPRLETNRKVSIPYAFKKIEEMGIMDNFAVAGRLKQGSYKGERQYHDSEFFKVIEGASYTLRLERDPQLEKYLARLAELIAAAQEDDGYLYTWRTVDPKGLDVRRCGKTRWSNLSFGHELYNVGHLHEAALAYYQATGKRTLLDVALKNAALIDKEFGPGRRMAPPGHQEIEIGLCKLYRLTGDEKYLKLAKFFLDERGYQHGGRELYGARRQDHKPVLEQNEAAGHAVRAGYMYSAMADVAALTGDSSYIKAIDTIWENVVSKKQYITGSVGARHKDEAFGDNYELPNKTAYNETCAAIANMMWNHRLFLLHGHAKYIDVLERVLYNGFLSGVSLAGDKFFYCNPLESDGQWKFNKGWATRFPWSASMCCPTNVTRFLPSLPGYVYAQQRDAIYVNLFIGGSAKIGMKNNTVVLKQETRYPWDGAVKIIVEPEKPAEFTINVRVPGWARNQPMPSDLYRYAEQSKVKVTLKVNGRAVDMDLRRGCARLRRVWDKGNVIEMNLPMAVRRVLCNDKVQENVNRFALERGPIVYCIEGVDNVGNVGNLLMNDEATLWTEYRKELFGGIVTIRGRAVARQPDGKLVLSKECEQNVVAIPYYAWSHRGVGQMAVWLQHACFPQGASPSGVGIKLERSRQDQ